MIELRPYQENLIKDMRHAFNTGKHSVCAVLGCGGGKSVIEGMIAKSAVDKDGRVLFLVHRKELCQQITATFIDCGVNLAKCKIAMVQTVTRRLEAMTKPQLIITDEAHRCLAATYQRIYDYWPDVPRVGFTATPMRMNEGGLGKVFDTLIESVSTPWLIANHYLAPYRYYSAKLADADDLHTKRGDYDSNEVAELMEDGVIYGETVKNWLNIANGKKTIVYCASVKASMETTESFKAAGISAAHIDGTTPANIRQELVAKFKAGEITVLCNVELFGEGFDVPDCECVVLLRPTKSLTLYIQQSMRSMRYMPGKTAIIIDHVGNVFRHNFPDADHEWTLKAKKQKQKNVIRIKECPVCYYVMSNMEKACPSCGYVFTKQEMAAAEIVDIELEELKQIDVLKALPYSHYKKVKTFGELVLFQKAKNYKFSWTLHRAVELGIEIPSNYNYMMRFIKI
jgi:DNA or RNA helicases of superfamily II